MIQLRKAIDRGHADHGWLNTYHTFSFADYHDPAHMSFRALRVINEDRVAPGMGFGTHGHRDMEIVSYVLSGSLEHRDSLGNGAILRPGEFQRISAGTGIRHSEFNPSAAEPAHFYQIWLLPRAPGGKPSYEQKQFAAEERRGCWQLVAAPDGSAGALAIGQDAKIYLATLTADSALAYDIPPGRYGWLQVLRGAVRVGGAELESGDGLAASNEPRLEIRCETAAELMLFDLA